MDWEIISSHSLTNSLITALFNDEVAAIRIPKFVSSNICKHAVHSIQTYGLEYYHDVYPKIGKIGITQNEHKSSPSQKLTYFAKTSEAYAIRQEALKDCDDLLINVMHAFGDSWDGEVDIAFEESINKHYFAGLVRVINKALVHFDWATKDAPDWAIGQISSQLAWNIFLQIGGFGGTTRIYHRFWQASDEQYKMSGSYAYRQSIIDECEFVEIAPEEGELVIFNSRNFHEVDATEGEIERITFSSFIGLIEDTKKLIFWS